MQVKAGVRYRVVEKVWETALTTWVPTGRVVTFTAMSDYEVSGVNIQPQVEGAKWFIEEDTEDNP